MTNGNAADFPVRELFTIDFMREHTQWNSFDGMTDMCADDITEADYGVTPSKRWDEFVAANTGWYNWEQMRQAAIDFHSA